VADDDHRQSVSRPAADDDLDRGRTRVVGDAPSGELKTVRSDSPSAQKSASAGSRIGRFEVIGVLGQGGMGRVLRARDPQLEREVALKLIRGGDSSLVERFLREARVQARVRHPHVCTVFEAGDADGQPYIAMELLPGKTLAAAASAMSQTEIAQVMRRVAEALHAAHREGLVHRDIKPTNIMVDRLEDGGWWPWVTDFGLARDQEAPGLTRTGAAVGTPSYMPPEQARGLGGALDARSDVYALGATMYDALAGQPPFAGESAADIILKLIQEEPPTLRQLGVSAPRDLESIVFQCLEKDPGRRYATAEEVAEDLGRFLRGEPVRARRVGPAVRAGKWLHRRRLVAGLAAATLVIAGALTAAWWHSARQARVRTELAAGYDEQVRFVEESLRHALTAPLHDLRPELSEARRRLRQLEQEVEAAGRQAVGPGAAALGRGYLALDDPEAARSHLEEAIGRGAGDPKVAAALGRALASLYRERHAAAMRHIGSERERLLTEAREELRDPARQLLEQARDLEIESPELVEALLASCEERYLEATQHAAAAHEKLPWLYMARVVEGAAWRELGSTREAQGDAAGAEEAFAAAEGALQTAAAVGRSDPAVHLALCDLGLARAEMGLFGAGRGLESAIADSLPHCEAVATANPDLDEGYLGASALWVRLAEWQVERDQDPSTALTETEAAARKALELAPESGEPQSRLGSTAVLRAQCLLNEERDPSAALAEAVSWFERALDRDPSRLEALANMGKAQWLAASAARGRGEDPRPALDRAAAAFEQAAGIDPDLAVTRNNLGATWYQRAAWEMEHGQDGSESLERAVSAFEAAAEINPGLVLVPLNLGYLHTVLANQALAREADPLPCWDNAVAAYADCLAIQPDHPFALARAAAIHSARAEHLSQAGGDAAADLDSAVRLLETLLASRSDHPDDGHLLAQALLERATWSADEGHDPTADVTHAAELLTEYAKAGAAEARETTDTATAGAEQLRATYPAAAERLRVLAQQLGG